MKKFLTRAALGIGIAGIAATGTVQINTADMRTYRNDLVAQETLNAHEAMALYKMKDKKFGLIDLKPFGLQKKARGEYVKNRDKLIGGDFNGKVSPDMFHITALYLGEDIKEKKVVSIY